MPAASPWPCRGILGDAGFTADSMDTMSEITLVKQGEGFAITKAHLTLTAKIPGIDEARFRSWPAWRKRTARSPSC